MDKRVKIKTTKEQQLVFIANQIKDTLELSTEFGDFEKNKFIPKEFGRNKLKKLFKYLGQGNIMDETNFFPTTRKIFSNLENLGPRIVGIMQKDKITNQEVREKFINVIFKLLDKKNVLKLAENKEKNTTCIVGSVKSRIKKQIIKDFNLQNTNEKQIYQGNQNNHQVHQNNIRENNNDDNFGRLCSKILIGIASGLLGFTSIRGVPRRDDIVFLSPEFLFSAISGSLIAESTFRLLDMYLERRDRILEPLQMDLVAVQQINGNNIGDIGLLDHF
jgi:hypothetical protein